jgi:hypothetical protein
MNPYIVWHLQRLILDIHQFDLALIRTAEQIQKQGQDTAFLKQAPPSCA